MTTLSPTPTETVLALDLLKLRYRQLLLNEMLKQKAFGGLPVHLAIGHEAIAVAVHHAMRDGDQLILPHRNIGFNLARAGRLQPILDEFRGRPEGAAGGRLGSMNLAQPDLGLPYTSSILGNNFSVACGFALAERVKGRGAVVFVVAGDGSMEEGAFYESLVFSRSHRLPLVFLIENNDMSMSSTIEQRRCPIDLEKMCGAYGVPHDRLEGNHVGVFATRLKEIRAGMEAEGRPSCVEVMTKSYTQHAGPTPGWPTDPKKIEIGNGLQVEAGPGDPVHVLSRELPPSLFEKLGEQAVAEVLAEKAELR